ncbi:MAG: MFS transporter [Candidatus Levybacteria bacterium]|nr:MFS transporter [Candidatus Levybacteria bacterium]
MIIKAFPAFKYHNYRLYFFGQIISMTGTWMQQVALAWLVWTLTHSAFFVGLSATMQNLPVLLFSLLGGAFVDRLNKKNILIATQASSMVIAFVLGLLTLFRIIEVWHILSLAFVLGTIDALDKPARQAFVVDIVDKQHLSSAIALNSGIFNTARLIGPSIAGLLIAFVDISGAFLVNTASYIPVIAVMFLIRITPSKLRKHSHPFRAVQQGLQYAFTHKTMRILLIFATVSSIFGWSYATMIPVVVAKVFNKGALDLGYFYAAGSIGGILAIAAISAFSKLISKKIFIVGGSIMFALSIILFSFSNTIPLAIFFLFFSGFGIISQYVTMNSTIQHIVPDDMRGRIMSLYVLMFIGMMPIGSFQVGLVAEHLGPLFAIRLGAIFVLIYSVYFFFKTRKSSFSKTIS